MTYKAHGIIVKRINFGEADRLITFYTDTMGKVRAKALSVRKIESKLAGHLELFSLSNLLFAKGRNLDIITSAQTANSFLNLRKDLKKTSFAYFISELIDKLVPEELKDTRIFNLLVETFTILDYLPKDAECAFVLLGFEIKLLELLGFVPQMSRCLHCGKGKSLHFYFSLQLGGILCENCKSYDRFASSISFEEIELVNLLRSQRIDSFKNFGNLKNFEAISLLSQKIDYFVRFIFGKNIKSVEFIKQVEKLEN